MFNQKQTKKKPNKLNFDERFTNFFPRQLFTERGGGGGEGGGRGGKRVREEVSDAHFHGKTITEQIVVALC